MHIYVNAKMHAYAQQPTGGSYPQPSEGAGAWRPVLHLALLRGLHRLTGLLIEVLDRLGLNDRVPVVV
jgi:hypothetical protein